MRRHRRPPGLSGREIGMYYKNLAAQKKTDKQPFQIYLTIPKFVIYSLQKNLKSIDKIAQELHINLSPLRNHDFFGKAQIKLLKSDIDTPTSAQSCDDDNIIEVKPKLEVIDLDLIEDPPYDSSMSIDFDISNPEDSCTTSLTKQTGIVKTMAPECLNSDGVSPQDKFDDFVKPFVVSTRYTDKPGTSSGYNQSNSTFLATEGDSDRILPLRNATDYKYGYKDIITGSFDEKLTENLSKGVEILKVNDVTNESNLHLYNDYRNMVLRPKYKQMLKFREKLPTYKKSDSFLKILEKNQVLVISGETGCGKSTQIPQIILDDALKSKKGANVNILVTEPRRIAASSLAMRVAAERAEKLGESTGYAVRLEKVDARSRGRIMYCTTGILLVDLEINQGLTNYSHIILDEVHERDTHIDLAMFMLKKVLRRRKDLKLILMSATIDAENLALYFDNCEMMHIEGLAYPVKDIFLEEILEKTGFIPNQQVSRPKNVPHYMKHIKRKHAAAEMQKQTQYHAEMGGWLDSIRKKYDRRVLEVLKDASIEILNIDLVFNLIGYICRDPPGAILVFLPGIGDITKLMRMLTESPTYNNSRFEIYPLHSKLPTLEQHRIFETPPPNVRKIIIATNIAETSITIDDIVYVIDCAKMKYSGLDVERNFSTLKTEWVSKANMHQRRGRAGRCQPGICYHLLTSRRAELIPDRLQPELQRSNLLEPVLAIKRLRLGMAAAAMDGMPAPPADTTVEKAVEHLQKCGALDDSETLTPLGWHLARLPIHPAAGKLLILGALFGCLNRAASVAAVWGFKDPFQLVIGKEKEVDKIKQEFALGEPSDHVAVSEAIIQWENCYQRERRQFSYNNFLSMGTTQLLSEMKRHLGENLKQMGFLATGDVNSRWENRNADNLSLFKAIVAASLYPNVASVKWRLRRRQKSVFIVHTAEDGRISVHPSSVMANKGPQAPSEAGKGANWLVYCLKQRSSELYLLDVTMVHTLPLLFFGELKVREAQDPNECLISISSAQVCCKKETTQLLIELRNLLDKVLAAKILTTDGAPQKLSNFDEMVLNAVIELITAEDERTEYFDESDSGSNSDAESNSWSSRRRY